MTLSEGLIFEIFLFEMSKIKNVSAFLRQIGGGGYSEKAWCYKAPLEALSVSELDQIVCVLQRVSGNPVKLAL